ncbi:probable vacuolar amino acid transporter YPQ1 isoform X3 [Glycine soja]|uniref:Putative vacuolar amino acid transporter YPQ3 isoform B n=1 Tax=Glycine soja TaxID=3848 RepID=A0A445M4K0_GLYSO|nr:probable vacuolar amino acid transporter YPQ1 isoform X3 [Glycine soja]KHN36154.1 Protein RTC2 [Glycine soja]RZC30531.1 putative vacuolar amino acid transporter YPQ3 isoform B [Glycine soja]RZC30532.1 putative vacuolar amino acid transporter YPQ3 isoform C [Glycine soja]
MPESYCVKESKPCVGWVEKYLDDCLCNLKDKISFGFGFISLVCWGVAEIPQIITNFRAKSSHGVSLAFLLTWVAGDIFNLLGCHLEPATLPTQYYTALLYTITTIVLVLQSFYYDYIYKWGKPLRKINIDEAHEEEEKKPLRQKPGRDSGIPIQNDGPKETPRRDYYYRSARSLAANDTPPFGTYLRAAKSVPSAMEMNNDSSSDDEAPPLSSTKPVTQPRPIPRSVPTSYGTFLAASMNLPRQGNALMEGYKRFNGRKLLSQEHNMHSALGQWLGWLMAVIYMGGRLPQIWLNIKRGSVEGLNPLMFIFALIANATYVGSILVRTIEWESIRANMPWLLDAIVCVALDLFIILQYANYRYVRKKTGSDDADYGDYKEASKTFVS